MTTNDHPFSTALFDLTAEELDRRYSDLMRRWGMARRMGMDQGVLHQLDLLLQSVESEKQRRALAEEKPGGTILDTDPITLPEFNRKR